jgi:DNA modification methylase
LWQIKSREDGGHGHGTQKPVECMRRPMLNNSNAGDTVYEPFLGSGTTLIAAQSSGRTCFAIELDPLYVDVAVRRWQAFTGEQAQLQQNGCTFDDVATQRLAASEPSASKTRSQV